MNPQNSCPTCGERISIRTLECPLCGEFIRSRDEARVLEQQTQLDKIALSENDQFFAAFVAGAELRGAMLGGADLFHADLAGADLRGADLGEALLSTADLSNADLRGANLVRADMTEANLCGADLSEANLLAADLHGAVYDSQTIFPDDYDPRRGRGEARMNRESYLERIGYTGPCEPTAATLRELQKGHLYSVPFENLDISLKRPIVLDRERLYDKVVLRRRGGFCYEVNGMFAWLLEELGFRVTLLSARDAQEDGTFGMEFDHLALLVHCPADEHPEIPWLGDVGWGDSFVEPLRLDTTDEQPQGLRAYRIEQDGELRLLWQRNYDGVWERQYGFTLTPREYAEFGEMCVYHQTSPDSPFTRKRIITRATPRGRISLSEGRLIVTEDGKRTEREIEAETYEAILLDCFGVVL